MNSEHTTELALSKSQLKDHIESFLRASGQIHDHQDIKIEFGNNLKSDDVTIPLTIKVRDEGKGYTIEH